MKDKTMDTLKQKAAQINEILDGMSVRDAMFVVGGLSSYLAYSAGIDFDEMFSSFKAMHINALARDAASQGD